jgi:hypothetical protein
MAIFVTIFSKKWQYLDGIREFLSKFINFGFFVLPLSAVGCSFYVLDVSVSGSCFLLTSDCWHGSY